MAEADTNVKRITVTGDAARATKKRRRSTQKGGSSDQSASNSAATSKVNVIQQLASSIPQSATTAPSLISAVAAIAQAPSQPGSQQGGANKQNVKLVPAKYKNKTRILLAPKGSTAPAAAHHGGGSTSKTRKQKRISLRVSNIRRKVASTRKHIHASTALPIEKIRKELVDAKLLNPASKAPEALIRKIYADYKITTNKA